MISRNPAPELWTSHLSYAVLTQWSSASRDGPTDKGDASVATRQCSERRAHLRQRPLEPCWHLAKLFGAAHGHGRPRIALPVRAAKCGRLTQFSTPQFRLPGLRTSGRDCSPKPEVRTSGPEVRCSTSLSISGPEVLPEVPHFRRKCSVPARKCSVPARKCCLKCALPAEVLSSGPEVPSSSVRNCLGAVPVWKCSSWRTSLFKTSNIGEIYNASRSTGNTAEGVRAGEAPGPEAL